MNPTITSLARALFTLISLGRSPNKAIADIANAYGLNSHEIQSLKTLVRRSK